MLKIANTTELQDELQRLLSYSQSERPSRSRIAKVLEGLSARLAGRSITAVASLMDLKDRLYNTPVKLKGYNGRPTVTQAHGTDAGKVLIQLAPDMTKSEHPRG